MTYEAERMKDIPFSSIRTIFEEVDRLKAGGQSVVPFHIGRPDFDTPQHIKDAAKQALDAGITAYTSNYGLLELRRAIADSLARDNGMRVDPERQVIVTVGANEAILLAMLATLNPGDEILVPDPMWLHYFFCARLAGARVVSVPLRAEDGYQLDPQEVERRITPRTRMIVLNSPHNPTGAVYPRATMEAVADIVYKHGLLLLSDEICQKMMYDGAGHVSPATIERIADQTLTVDGFSKTYAMTGWRLGYVVASPALVDSMIRVHQYTTVCATSFAQAGAVAALRGSQRCVAEMVAEFDRRRRAVIAACSANPALELVMPQGAFYAFPRIAASGLSSEQFAAQLLHEAGVAVVPGSAFGEYGEGHVRIAYACSLPNVERGMASLGNLLQRLQLHN
ncbi:MAG: aminotransferase class I/II-fold pyridoxal phosphate-dependent enzyme [Herpetosiphon sp.]